MAASRTERITRTPGVCGGRACIAGHRVRVLDIVVSHEQQGLTPDEIVSQIPSITLADVHAALAYYYDHREEIQDEIRVERKRAEEFSPEQPLAARTARWERRSSEGIDGAHFGRVPFTGDQIYRRGICDRDAAALPV